MYVIFSGARKNMGDFLIEDRLCRLIAEVRPDHEVVVLPRWRPLNEEEMEICHKADLFMLGGGPFYRPDLQKIFEGILVDYHNFNAPIAFVAGGWKGMDGTNATIAEYHFPPSLIELLLTVSNNISLSCRDHLTRRVLENNNLSNIKMTGCSSWYDIEHLGMEMRLPEKVENIAISVPENPSLHSQVLGVVDICRSVFQNAVIHVSFNRGISNDQNTDEKMGHHLRKLVTNMEASGAIIHDTSYDLSTIDFHQICEIHIGYRVHSHLAFCSVRKPSYLLHEDGRGVGASLALDTPGFNAFEVNEIAESSTLLWRAIRLLLRGFREPKPKPDNTLHNRLEAALIHDRDTEFSAFSSLSNTIDEHYPIMRDWLLSLP